MAEDISNLIVEHLKAIRAEIAAVNADTAEIKELLQSHASISRPHRRA